VLTRSPFYFACLRDSDIGGHPRALEMFLQRSVDQAIMRQPGLPAAAAVVPALSNVEWHVVFREVVNSITDQYQLGNQLNADVIGAIIITAILEDAVDPTAPAHPAHKDWTFLKLNEKGFIVLESDKPAAGSLFVRLPFVWLLVYLQRLSTVKHLVKDALEPLDHFLRTSKPLEWGGWEEFNCLFLALRINLLKLKLQLLRDVLPPSELRISVGTLCRGAVISGDIADTEIVLPSNWVRTAEVSGAISRRCPANLHPKTAAGKDINWRSGEVVVRNVAGGPQDHFFALLRPAGQTPLLGSGQAKLTHIGDAFSGEDFTEEYEKSMKSVSHLASEFAPLFGLFANRPAGPNLDLCALPNSCVVVLAEHCRKFYGYTFFERAIFASTASCKGTGTPLSLLRSKAKEHTVPCLLQLRSCLCLFVQPTT
jgi:hypothetical protein